MENNKEILLVLDGNRKLDYSQVNSLCSVYAGLPMYKYSAFNVSGIKREELYSKISNLLDNTGLIIADFTSEQSTQQGVILQMACDKSIPIFAMSKSTIYIPDVIYGMENIFHVGIYENTPSELLSQYSDFFKQYKTSLYKRKYNR